MFKKQALVLIVLSFTLLNPMKTHGMDPKVKAVMLMAGYGTVGGALLGTATLAFGAEGRSVAKGASIGLYVGILFGGYVVLSHTLKKRKPQPDPQIETDDTYEESGLFGSSPLRFQQNFNLNHEALASNNDVQIGFNSKKQDLTLIHVPLLTIQF